MSYNQSQIGFYGVYNFYLYKIYVNKLQIFVIFVQNYVLHKMLFVIYKFNAI